MERRPCQDCRRQIDLDAAAFDIFALSNEGINRLKARLKIVTGHLEEADGNTKRCPALLMVAPNPMSCYLRP